MVSPKLSGAAPTNHASHTTIAFLESDRADAPRAGDAYGDDPAAPAVPMSAVADEGSLPPSAEAPSRDGKMHTFGESATVDLS